MECLARMSEVYNPESSAFERLEAFELEARHLRQKLDTASDSAREVIQRQLDEIEERISVIKRRLRP